MLVAQVENLYLKESLASLQHFVDHGCSRTEATDIRSVRDEISLMERVVLKLPEEAKRAAVDLSRAIYSTREILDDFPTSQAATGLPLHLDRRMNWIALEYQELLDTLGFEPSTPLERGARLDALDRHRLDFTEDEYGRPNIWLHERHQEIFEAKLSTQAKILAANVRTLQRSGENYFQARNESTFEEFVKALNILNLTSLLSHNSAEQSPDTSFNMGTAPAPTQFLPRTANPFDILNQIPDTNQHIALGIPESISLDLFQTNGGFQADVEDLNSLAASQLKFNESSLKTLSSESELGSLYEDIVKESVILHQKLMEQSLTLEAYNQFMEKISGYMDSINSQDTTRLPPGVQLCLYDQCINLPTSTDIDSVQSIYRSLMIDPAKLESQEGFDKDLSKEDLAMYSKLTGGQYFVMTYKGVDVGFFTVLTEERGMTKNIAGAFRVLSERGKLERVKPGYACLVGITKEGRHLMREDGLNGYDIMDQGVIEAAKALEIDRIFARCRGGEQSNPALEKHARRGWHDTGYTKLAGANEMHDQIYLQRDVFGALPEVSRSRGEKYSAKLFHRATRDLQ